MVIVTIREVRLHPRCQRHFQVKLSIDRAVRRALLLYFAGDGYLPEPITAPGKYRRIVERDALLPRDVEITVRVQGELFEGR